MHYKRDYKCDDCKNCINDPGEVSCNIACADTKKNCYESYKVFSPNIYGKATIELQPYDNLFDLNKAFAAGTIFQDLYSPYCAVKYVKEDA